MILLRLVESDPNHNYSSTDQLLANSSDQLLDIDMENTDTLTSVLFAGRYDLLKKFGLSKNEAGIFKRPDALMEQCSFFLCKHGVVISIFQVIN